MNVLVTTALVGTAQQPSAEIATGTEIDALTQGLADGEAEHKLLLGAGMWSVYQQAGTVADTLTGITEPSAPEALNACTPAIAALVEGMLKGEYSTLLPEALTRMQWAGQRVPHTMVASILNVQDIELRSAIYPVLGERGRWLSQFNPAWSWVSNYLQETQAEGLAQAESIWQEGPLEQRVKVLRLLRSREATRAREWLAEVWTHERAEARTKLLTTLRVGLTLDDEEFLEKALDDRAADVRSTAASLLTRLPASAFAERMQKRADTMLRYAAGKLTVILPTTFEKDWLRDGILAKPHTHGLGEQSWWFMQILSHARPAHWTEHFGATMDKLIAVADANEDWHEAIVACWSNAAYLYSDVQWCIALWDYWSKKQPGTSMEVRTALLSPMSQSEVEQRVLDLFSNRKHPVKDWHKALFALPTPWSRNFSEKYLQELRSHIASLDFKTNTSVYSDSWYQSIQRATLALPPACFVQASQSWTVPEVPVDMAKHTVWRQYWQQELKKFIESVRIRQRLIEEIVA